MAKQILYIQYSNPACYPPIEHSSKILDNDGWKVLLLGVHVQGTENINFPHRERTYVHMLPVATSRRAQIIRYIRFLLRAVYFYCIFRPKWVYSSDMLSYPIALILFIIFRAKVVLHEHDTPVVNGKKSQRILFWCRTQLAKRAKLCVLPQTQRAEKFIEENRVNTVNVVWNVPTIDEIPSNLNKKTSKISMWYHGSITPPQFPVTIIDSLVELPENVVLKFAGYETKGHSGYIDKLFNTAKEKNVAHRVEYLGTFNTRKDLYNAASECHLGLSLFDSNFREPMVGASNKPFDYLACGLVLLVTDTNEWRLYENFAYFVDPSDSDSISNAVNKYIVNNEESLKMGDEAKKKIIADWNYETQFSQVKRVLEK